MSTPIGVIVPTDIDFTTLSLYLDGILSQRKDPQLIGYMSGMSAKVFLEYCMERGVPCETTPAGPKALDHPGPVIVLHTDHPKWQPILEAVSDRSETHNVSLRALMETARRRISRSK